MTDATIAANRIYSESEPEAVAKLLNCTPRIARLLGPCLVYPHFDLTGNPMGHAIVKPDQPRPRKSKNGKPPKRNKYECPKGTPNRAYFPVCTRPVLTDPTAAIIITEGTKKSLKATQEGFPTISIQGVWTWCVKRPKRNGKGYGPFKLIPDLASISWKGRRVYLCYDSDAATKPSVREAERAFAQVLRREGADVRIVRLPSEPDGEKNGIDDYLVRHGVENFRELLAATTEEPKPQPKDGGEATFKDPVELDRLAALKLDDAAEFAAYRVAFKNRGGSVSDLEKAIKDRVAALCQQREEERRKAAAESGDTWDTPASPYSIRGGIIIRSVPTKEGSVDVPLGNFSALISSITIRDDGAERRHSFTISGQTANGSTLEPADVLASEFAGMAWVPAAWGNRAVVYAGMGVKDHFRVAIQILSGHAPTRTVFAHSGWREVNGQWVYLHADGAIGLDDSTNEVHVDLTGPLAKYLLPEPPTGRERIAAVRAVLSPFSKTAPLAPDRVLVPIFGAVFRAVLGGSLDFGLHVFGRTGVFKSELAALGQQCFGSGLDSRNLPANWSSTANALEGTAFAAKDAILVIDDFNPTGATDPAKLHAAADRLFRGVGNGAGRGRLNADLSARPDRPSRAMILSTGEDVPKGHSLRARVPIVEVKPGDVDLAILTKCQRDASTGLYAGMLAVFIQWLAPHYGEIRARLPKERTEARDSFAAVVSHARTPSAVADLMVGWRYFLGFAVECGAITSEQQQQLLIRVRAALLELADAQAEHLQAADPVEQFMQLVPSLLASGDAYLEAVKGGRPDFGDAFGWAQRSGEWQATGSRVGWVDDQFLYLMADSLFAELQKVAAAQRNPMNMSARTLWTRLRERGILLPGETRGGKPRHTIRLTFSGVRFEVLKIDRSALYPVAPSVPSVPKVAGGWEIKATAWDTRNSGVSQSGKECPKECPNPSPSDPSGSSDWDTRRDTLCDENPECPNECPTVTSDDLSTSAGLGHLGHSTDTLRGEVEEI